MDSWIISEKSHGIPGDADPAKWTPGGGGLRWLLLSDGDVGGARVFGPMAPRQGKLGVGASGRAW